MPTPSWSDPLIPSDDPEFEAAVEREIRRDKRAERLTNPLKRIPLVGDPARVFWYLVLTDGDPRDGLVFSYLNDGMHPTLWHTVVQVTRPDGDPDVGIWVPRAPRSRAEAETMKAGYRKSASATEADSDAG